MNKILSALLVTVFSASAMKEEKSREVLAIEQQLETLRYLREEAQAEYNDREATHKQFKAERTAQLLKNAEDELENINEQIQAQEAELALYTGSLNNNTVVISNQGVSSAPLVEEEQPNDDFKKLLDSMLKSKKKDNAINTEEKIEMNPINSDSNSVREEEKNNIINSEEKIKMKKINNDFNVVSNIKEEVRNLNEDVDSKIVNIKSNVNSSLERRIYLLQEEKKIYDEKIEKINDSNFNQAFFAKSQELIENYHLFYNEIVNLSLENLNDENDEKIETHLNNLSNFFNESKTLKADYETMKDEISQKYDQKIEQERIEAERIEAERIEEERRIEQERIEEKKKEEPKKILESKGLDLRRLTKTAKMLGITDAEIDDIFYAAEEFHMDIASLFHAAIKEVTKKKSTNNTENESLI